MSLKVRKVQQNKPQQYLRKSIRTEINDLKTNIEKVSTKPKVSCFGGKRSIKLTNLWQVRS